MKNIISIVILIIVGLIAYNNFNKTYTPDEQYLRDLESDFNQASRLMTQAERGSAASGVDTTTSFEQGIERIRNIRRDLLDFINEINNDPKSEVILKESNTLLGKVNNFLTRQGYPSEPE